VPATSYITPYGSPYLGASTGQTAQTAQGLVQIPAATQLSHAAAIAAATSQFYDYQVCCVLFFLSNFG
jgi:hypothetical protein